MILREAIVLAGGLGTRLRSAVPDLPKCMAPVNGKPFIAWVIDYFRAQGIDKFIFSLGYKHELIEQYLDTQYAYPQPQPPTAFQYTVEREPLGTGGAIRLACRQATAQQVLVLNGDTLFKIQAQALADFHQQHGADCSLALKPMKDFDRYGVVAVKEDGRISDFKEKQFYKQGLINGGVYVLNPAQLLAEPLPEQFSFEKDYLEPGLLPQQQRKLYGMVQDEYFIDIGIPADYERAQTEMLPV
jgi:D-glycero-alpha-D-manno-heptose 1-phosphate guanylyltransferase